MVLRAGASASAYAFARYNSLVRGDTEFKVARRAARRQYPSLKDLKVDEAFAIPSSYPAGGPRLLMRLAIGWAAKVDGDEEDYL